MITELVRLQTSTAPVHTLAQGGEPLEKCSQKMTWSNTSLAVAAAA